MTIWHFTWFLIKPFHRMKAKFFECAKYTDDIIRGYSEFKLEMTKHYFLDNEVVGKQCAVGFFTYSYAHLFFLLSYL